MLWCAFSEETSCEFGSAKYYALCGFGGILSCGITHTAVVPLDLVKCRIQVDIVPFVLLWLLPNYVQYLCKNAIVYLDAIVHK